jgi:hypothetical protein
MGLKQKYCPDCKVHPVSLFRVNQSLRIITIALIAVKNSVLTLGDLLNGLLSRVRHTLPPHILAANRKEELMTHTSDEK